MTTEIEDENIVNLQSMDTDIDEVEEFARQLDAVVLRDAPKSLDNLGDDDTTMQTKNNDGSDSDFDDGELAPFAYQQLPQEDEEIELQEDEDMSSDVDAEHARPLPAITFKLPTEERISEADLAVINNVMKNFKLPNTAVPDWAKVVPEEAWLPQMASTTTATPTNASITSTISKLRNLNDDIWDDSDDDIVSYHRSMANREWERLHEQHGNAGYKDGIVEGKDLTIQEGFNRGYNEGVMVGKEIGELRGMLSTSSPVQHISLFHAPCESAAISLLTSHFTSFRSTLITFYTQTSTTDSAAATHLPRLRALHDEISAISVEHIFTKDYFRDKEERIRAGTAAGCCEGTGGEEGCCGGKEDQAEGCAWGKEKSACGKEKEKDALENVVDPVEFVAKYRKRVEEMVAELGL